MIISEIQIIPIRPRNGLVSFASFIINDQFYVGNVAILTSPKTAAGFRLQYPTKKLSTGKQVACFHPISNDVEQIISERVVGEYVKLMDNFYSV